MDFRSLLLLTTLTLSSFFGFYTLLVGGESNLAQASSIPLITRFTTYVVRNEFSIQHPTGWFVKRTVNQPGEVPRQLVMLQNLHLPKFGSGQSPLNLIKTDIQIEPGSFELVANQVVSGLGAEGGRLTRKGHLSVGGRKALRLWATDSDFGVESIVTLVPYGNNETAYIASFYDKSNPAAIRVIQTIHWSFRVLD